ncbi:helix-turn-helix transcriptional regulator [Thalassobius sp. Cn5-15]|uniref:helix-turn-helix transcriptional regulator n=1 Tax=Thalassobius sp. Cn5-15 TaxID=2917763 RepID=UPI001EF23525|nr:helix-turn-helix transcriptional regulator [Thalassobius sp. Cn5-15]MCG7495209.1 helix-turn-helix domain-containing protein [Thalassobius sp. Cn5-15]
MPQGQLTGTRIRERRIMQGLRQAELAQKAGISASYLNLIEHNRRRIGGKLLLSLAEVLNVEPSLLSEGAEAAMIATLGEARAADPDAAPVEETPEAFAGRYPGWAELLTRRHRRVLELERTVEVLNDRLTHDPYLAAALHEVLSTVTAIRSTAGILADTPELEPEWRDRFYRNLNEDAARLADGAQGLVAYLDQGGEAEGGVTSPQEELEAFLNDSRYHIAALERATDAGAAIETLLERASVLQTASGRGFARAHLQRYAQDARDMPLADVLACVHEMGVDPAAVARNFSVSLPRAMQRLADLPSGPINGEGGQELPAIGLVSCDASGTLIFRKPVDGFSLPRFGAACPKWPLFQALSRPMVPLHHLVQQDQRGEASFDAYAVAEPTNTPDFDTPPLFQAHMLIVARTPGQGGGVAAAQVKTAAPVVPVGISCRICPVQDCAPRREPSILSDGF